MAIVFQSLFIALLLFGTAQANTELQITPMMTDLSHPWGMAFLPDGTLLVTERGGALYHIDLDNSSKHSVTGVPKVAALGQGGLLDVAVHPDFATNRLIYLSYAGGQGNSVGTEVARARLAANRLTQLEIIFQLDPKTHTGYHFGSRLVFDQQGYLYITNGDRGVKERAQNLADHAGSVVRLHDDGTIPSDNPFIDQGSAHPGIYTFGHRNPQGMVVDSANQIWIHEHGPQGGDELNLIEAGKNYGWPVITYGVNYGSGTPIGEGYEKPGMAQPRYHWIPSIAPSGMALYRGDLFPQWQGDLLLGSLKFRMLVRLDVEQGKIVAEERYIKDRIGRIRDVEIDPHDGSILVLTDERNGGLYRLTPATP
ncbi:PQQ-dependent sugar dehydrogenase [Ectothiorhodospiraceae bacterium BW-2]|nr:PQQ-dependent sugar dehydrogenase [Ectothiorhodospiraceae bacterium BW-2]